ncbi:tetratricopeptide repeat protein [bacterium]|nr:tetratricopeptide repeat protein [bacterium]
MKTTVSIFILLFITTLSFSMTPFDEGYKTEYDLGFDKGYKSGYNKGHIAGSTKGKSDGMNKGRMSVLKPYINLSYGPSIEKYSDKNIHIRRLSSSWEMGYDLGYKEGKTEGYKSGYDQGKSIEYKNAFRKSYILSEQKTHDELYYKDEYKMTDKQQYENAIENHQSGNFKNARNHFNLILRDYPDSQFVKETLWWCAKTNEKLNKKIDSAIIYLSLIDNFQSLREKASVECSKILIDLRTETSSSHKNTYFKQAINCTKIVINEYPESEFIPEVMYIQGICYENLNKTETSRAILLDIIINFPTSPFAAKAKIQLKKPVYSR